MAIDTAAPSRIIRPSFDPLHDNPTKGLGDLTNKIVDWRGRVGRGHYRGANKENNTIYLINGGNVKASTIFTGGSIKETEPAYVDGTWSFTHGNDLYGENSPGLRIEAAPEGSECQGFDFDGCMDAILPAPSLPDNHVVRVRNFRAIRTHDDCIQNDGARYGEYYNGLMKGHVALSVRPGPEGNPTLLENHFTHCLIHMDRQRYTTEEPDGGPQVPFAGSKRSGQYRGPSNRNNTIIGGTNLGWAHKFWLKSSEIGSGTNRFKAKGSMSHCLIRIDTPPVEGYNNPGVFPVDWDYNDVTVCWCGPPANGTGYGPWPFPQSKSQLAGMGITLIDDEEDAFNLWEETEAYWYFANGWNGSTFSWNRLT